LSSKQLDDGNGLLRASFHNHKHEIISGETSSLVSHVNIKMVEFIKRVR